MSHFLLICLNFLLFCLLVWMFHFFVNLLECFTFLLICLNVLFLLISLISLNVSLFCKFVWIFYFLLINLNDNGWNKHGTRRKQYLPILVSWNSTWRLLGTRILLIIFLPGNSERYAEGKLEQRFSSFSGN